MYGTPDEEDFIKDIYPKCQNISIDYGILEKEKQILVVLSDFGWSDLGTWGSVYNHLPKDSNNNAFKQSGIALYESSDNVIRISPNMKAVIQGLTDYIIVESNGTLLICSKDQEQRIKEFSKSFS